MNTQQSEFKSYLKVTSQRITELEREKADRDLTLATIQDIIDDSYRSDRAKILAIKYALSQ